MSDGRVGKWRIFDNKNYLLLWTGSVTTTTGFSAVGVAYPLVTLDLTASPVLAGCAAFAGILPSVLFGIPAGMVADVKNRYRVLLACQRIGLMGTLLALLAVMFRVPGVWMALFMAAAFIESTAQAFFYVAELAFVRTIVSENERPAAYAMFNAEIRIAQIAGRTVAAGLVAVARSLPFIANAVSYLYCLRTLLAIRRTTESVRKVPRARPGRLMQWKHPGAGLRVLFTERYLWTTTGMLAGIEVAFAISQLHVVIAIRTAGGSSTTVGIVLGAFGIGGFFGALVATWLTDRFTTTNLLAGTMAAWAALLVPVAVDAGTVVLALCWAGVGAVTAVAALSVNLAYLRLIPDDILGRTEGAIAFMMAAGGAIGALLSGLLHSVLGGSTTMWVVVGAMALAAYHMKRMAEPCELGLQEIDIRPTNERLAQAVDNAERWVGKVVDLTDPIVAMFGGTEKITAKPAGTTLDAAEGTGVKERSIRPR